MTDPTSQSATPEVPGIADVRELAQRLLDAHCAFYAVANRDNPASDLRTMLTSGNTRKQRAALLLCRFLDWSGRLSLTPEIYSLTQNDELADQALWMLSTLPVQHLRQRLSPLIFERLEESDQRNDPNIWMSTARLLDHLGLPKDLKHVAMLALAHENPEVRNVGRDMVIEML